MGIQTHTKLSVRIEYNHNHIMVLIIIIKGIESLEVFTYRLPCGDGGRAECGTSFIRQHNFVIVTRNKTKTFHMVMIIK